MYVCEAVRRRSRFSSRALLLAGAVISTVGVIGSRTATAAPLEAVSNTTWRAYQGGPHSSNYSALKQIDRTNVNRLQVAWTYPTEDKVSYVFSPIVIGRVMYTLAKNGQLAAVDAEKGTELWTAPLPDGASELRGINYWESADQKDRRIFAMIEGYMYAFNAEDGKAVLTFGDGGRVWLKEGLDRDPTKLTGEITSNSPGQIFENLLIIGSSPGELVGAAPGDIRAFDARTGKLVWSFHTIPRPGEFGYDTWPKDAWTYIGGANVWGDLTLDRPNGILFAPTGSPTSDFYGGGRLGDNLYGNSLIAIDARTGKRIWHYQTIHHDLWDYDLVSAPQLVTIRQNGKARDVVAQAGKTGFLYVFDRKTGEPIWPIEERPVPQTDVPGERTSPTQPFPTKPPPFARQSFTADDVNDLVLTPEEQAYFKDFTSKAVNEGLFTPPAVGKYVVNMPGSSGGAALYGAASDPGSGTVYVVSFDMPAFRRLETSVAATRTNGIHGPRIANLPPCESVCRVPPVSPPAAPPPPDALPYPTGAVGAPTQQYYSGYGFAPGIGKPPWSSLTAYDLNIGEIKWKIPYGSAVGVEPKDNNFGLLQFHSPKAPPVPTAGGVIFSATADRKLRAYDRDNGKIIWSTDLPDRSMGGPAVYELNGRQYVAIPTRGAVVAYSLPF